MKTTSRFALVAAAGLLMSGLSVAKAADLGGDCCADLEERVAELEATTVRKGNRKVSLELSGQVNKGILIWNDGKASDAYVVDNNVSSTRFRMKGTGTMMPGWKAGFYMEYEFRDSSSNLVTQVNQDLNTLETSLRIRQENVFVESEKFGRVTIGQQSSASKDIELINLGGDLVDPENYYSASFKVRDNTRGTNNGITNSSLLGWSPLANTYDVGRLQAARYDTPSLYGFIFSAAMGENDFWDVALRFQKEWNSIRFAAGVGYFYGGDPVNSIKNAGGDGSQVLLDTGVAPQGVNTKWEQIKGSASIMHVPTGLYAVFAAGERHLNGPLSYSAGYGITNRDSNFWYVKGGITKRFFDVGATTVFADYGNYDKQGVGATYDTGVRLSDSNATRYGFGMTQAFDGAALELYANYQHFSADLSAVNSSGAAVKVAPQDFDAVITGARIKF